MLVVRLGAILMFITALAASALALINKSTAPIIAENKAKEAQLARMEVTASLGDVTFDEVTTEDGMTYYVVKDQQGSVVGYVGTAYGKGYSSTVETVTGMDSEFHIVGMKVLFQQETPGLGTKSQDASFLDQFSGKLAQDVKVRKDGGTIDSITGATITSRAVSNSVQVLAREIEASVAANKSTVPEGLNLGTLGAENQDEVEPQDGQGGEE